MHTRAMGRIDIAQGFWRLADPKISLASFASLFLGASLAAAHGPFYVEWFALTVLAVFAIEVAKNASGEVFDLDSGADLAVAEADRTPFSGGKRVLVDGLLTRRQTIAIAAFAYGAAIALGAVIVVTRTPSALPLGVAGLLLAWQYQAPPLRLSYRGWGEFAVALAYGPLLCGATYVVQRGWLAPEAMWVAMPFGLLVAAFLWINEIPDCAADRSANKWTLVARLGRHASSRVFVAIVATAFVALVLLPLAGLPRMVWLGGIAAPPALFAVVRVLRGWNETRELVPAQAATLASFVLLALGTGLGLLWSGR